MTTTSVVIYRKRNTIISINLSVMFDKVATRILSNIIYPSITVALTPYIVFCPCQSFINSDRIMPRTPICSKVNNLCHILINLNQPRWAASFHPYLPLRISSWKFTPRLMRHLLIFLFFIFSSFTLSLLQERVVSYLDGSVYDTGSHTS